MKILQLIPDLNLGGTQQAMVYLLPEIQNLGHRCEVAGLFPPYPLASELEKRGVRVHLLDFHHRWSFAEGVAKLAKLVRAENYDVVHGKQYFGSVYGALSAPFSPKSVRVASFHNMEYDYDSVTQWTKVRKRIQAACMKRWVSGFATLSHACVEHYQRHLGLEDITVLPNAVPLEEVRREASADRRAILAEFGAKDSDFVLLCPSRLIPEKGHVYLVRALRLLVDRGLVPRTLFLAWGPTRDAIREEIQKLGLGSHITMPDEQVPNVKMRKVMAAADLIVVPSTFEAFGLAPAEAMALERPVIASRTGGLVDLIEDGVSGLLVPPKDPEALAEAIGRIMQDPDLRKRLSLGGRTRIETHFSTQTVAKATERFYLRVLSEAERR